MYLQRQTRGGDPATGATGAVGDADGVAHGVDGDHTGKKAVRLSKNLSKRAFLVF